MSMSDALSKIERHTAFMLNAQYESPDEFRQSFQKSRIVHDLRWLTPELEFTQLLSGMEALHLLDHWTNLTANTARLYLEGVEFFLEGVRLGYRHAQAQEVTA